jgi:hypothetical protein
LYSETGKSYIKDVSGGYEPRDGTDCRIDYEIIWDVATKYLPENKEQIETILRTDSLY